MNKISKDKKFNEDNKSENSYKMYVDGEEVGRVSKLVYSYVKNVNNGYILAKKDTLHIGDHLKIHGYECVITEKNWLQ